MFDEAGLPFERFTEVQPEWVPPAAFDVRKEWTGAAAWAPDIPLRVSASSFLGRPISFEVLGPWSHAWMMETIPVNRSRRIAQMTIGLSVAIVIGFAIYLARRNLNRGRGDRRGAIRLAVFMIACSILAWAAGAHHVADLAGELSEALEAIARALILGALSGLFYVAVEPYARGRVPSSDGGRLVEDASATRVGQDILVGTLVGGLTCPSADVTNALPTWISISGQTTVYQRMQVLQGGRWLLAFLWGLPQESFPPAMTIFGLLLLLRVVLKRPAAAMVALMAILTLINLGAENVLLETPGALVTGVLAGFAIARFGLPDWR